MISTIHRGRRSKLRRSQQRAYASLALTCALLASCEENKPYTPFEVATALPERPAVPQDTAPPPEPGPQDGSAGPLRRALKAPRGARTWKIADQTLNAPDGHVLELALPLPPTPGKDGGIVVWTVRPRQAEQDSTPAAGTLWFHGPGQPRRLIDLPGFVPSSPDCEQEASLDQTGPSTLTLDVTARCTARLVARAPTRSLLVLDPHRDDPLLMGFRVADAATGEKLLLAVDSRDLDEDGRDDITLQATVGAANAAATATVQFAWFDRAAGRSRDAREPAASFKKTATRLSTWAKNKKNAASVSAEADALRRLYASACSESATSRLWHLDGSALSCGGAEESLTSVLLAEIEAALTLDSLLEAVGLLERDGWFGARLGAQAREALQKKILSKVRHGDATSVASFPADLPPRTHEPRFSPLFFDAEGHLWVQTRRPEILLSAPPGTPARSAFQGTAGAPQGPPEPKPWPLRVTLGAGRTWTGVIPSCDRSELQLSFAGPGGQPLPPLPTELLAPRPGVCKGGKPSLGPAVPIGWHASQLDAWIAGTRIAPSEAPASAPGAPLSADGKVLVLPTPLGLALVREGKLEIWRGDRLHGLTDCVPSVGALHLACARGQNVVVIKRPAELSH